MQNEIMLPCTEGNAKIRAHMIGKREHPQLLTGKRRRWDSLSWSLFCASKDGREVALQGLWRGSYADAMVLAKDLHKALLEAGMVESAKELANACAANGETF